MDYAIFISYRREGGAHYARILKAELEKRGYAGRVFLDYDELKDGVFDERIKNAIKTAPIFIFIMSPGALDRCSDPNDWVRREIELAFKCERHIIPVNFDRLFSDFTPGTPDIIRAIIGQHQFSSVDTQSLLNASVDELIRYRIAPVVPPLGVHERPGVAHATEQEAADYGFDPDYEEAEFLENEGDYASAVVSYLTSARNGNRKAFDRVFGILSEKPRLLANVDDGFRETVSEMESNGDSEAYLLMYFLWAASEADEAKAFSCLRSAMNKNPHPIAFLMMGRCYGWGLGVRQNEKLALHYYRKAVDCGCVQAYSYLGQTLLGNADPGEIEKIYREGIAKGDRRCYKKLFWLLEGEDADRAEKFADSLIAQDIVQGYTLKANYLMMHAPGRGHEIESLLSAAVAKNSSEACGLLSLYYYNNNRIKEARQIAARGKAERDVFSMFLVGSYAEDEHDYATAWQNYEECYNISGTYAVNMARLYLDRDYIPDSDALGFLKQALRVCSLNGEIDAVNAMLRVMVKEKDKDDVSYFELQKIPESYEYIKMGADLNDPFLLYCYGKLMLADNSPYINPTAAITMFEKSARLNNSEGLSEVLFHYQNRGDKESLRKWADFAVENNIVALTRDYLTDKEAFRLLYLNTTMTPDRLAPYVVSCFNEVAGRADYHFALINVVFEYIMRGLIELKDEVGENETAIERRELENWKKMAESLLGNDDSAEEFHVGYIRRARHVLSYIFDFDPLKASVDPELSPRDLKLLYATATNLKGDDLIFDYLIEDLHNLFDADKSHAELLRMIASEDSLVKFSDVEYYLDYKVFEAEYSEIESFPGTVKPELEPLELTDVKPIFSPIKAVAVNLSVMKAVIYLSRLLPDWSETVRKYIYNFDIFGESPIDSSSVLSYYSKTHPDAPVWLTTAEMMIDESSELFVNARTFWTGSLDNDPSVIAAYLNKCVDFLKSHGLETDLPLYHSRNIPESLIYIAGD